MQVIQETKPIKILLPIYPNEIDYTLGVEIKGNEKKEEKKEEVKEKISFSVENTNFNIKNNIKRRKKKVWGPLVIEKDEAIFQRMKNFWKRLIMQKRTTRRFIYTGLCQPAEFTHL